MAPAVKVESCVTKEHRETQQPPIRITHHLVAEVNRRESRRRTFEYKESQYSTSMDLQPQQQEQNRNMLNIQQQQNQQVQQLLKQQQLHTLQGSKLTFSFGSQLATNGKILVASS